jgi:hypothetical protein
VIVIIIKCDVQFGLVLFHALILIAWHGWLSLKHIWITQFLQGPNVFFLVYHIDYLSHTCQRRKFLNYDFKLHFQTPYIQKMVTKIKFGSHWMAKISQGHSSHLMAKNISHHSSHTMVIQINCSRFHGVQGSK